MCACGYTLQQNNNRTIEKWNKFFLEKKKSFENFFLKKYFFFKKMFCKRIFFFKKKFIPFFYCCFAEAYTHTHTYPHPQNNISENNSAD